MILHQPTLRTPSLKATTEEEETHEVVDSSEVDKVEVASKDVMDVKVDNKVAMVSEVDKVPEVKDLGEEAKPDSRAREPSVCCVMRAMLCHSVPSGWTRRQTRGFSLVSV